MRSNPVARMILGAAALTLVASGAVAAQDSVALPTDTRFPEEIPSLVTSVVTSALDDELTTQRIETSVRAYQQTMGGRTKAPPDRSNQNKKAQQRGGIMMASRLADTEAVTQEVLDLVGELQPDLLIVSGGDGQTNAIVAGSAQGTVIVDIGQPRPCLTAAGQPDLAGDCAGGAAAVPSNYRAVEFAVEDAAFLAGVVAARLSRSSIGVIGGYEGCRECQRYIEGFVNGARSVEPDVIIETAYLSDDEVGGFSDAESAKTFTEAFIDVVQPDVILPVARGATTGMIEAACEAGIQAVGTTGFDVSDARPSLEDCVMASITTDLERAVTDAMYLYSRNQTLPVATYDLANGGVRLTGDWTGIATLPVDTEGLYTEAELQLRTGEIEACPDGCGGAVRLDEPAESDPAG